MKKTLLMALALVMALMMLCACSAPAAAPTPAPEAEAPSPAPEAEAPAPAPEAEAPAAPAIRPVDTISGTSDKVDPAAQMSQEDIRTMILDYLRGFSLGKNADGSENWAYREMYQIATVSPEGYPGLSSVEFVLDPTTMRLYASCEKGTEKCAHIPNNPNVVMYWYKQVPEEEYIPQVYDYFSSYGVQIKGTANLMEPAGDEFYRVADMYMRTLYGVEKWDGMSAEDQKARIDGISKSCDWIEICPTEYNVTTLWWVYNREGSSRPQHYDPNSPTFGYSARQEYYVVD